MALEQITFNIAAFNDADAGGNNYFAGEIYEVFNTNDTLADIYSDAAGANPINQDGISNKSNASGEVVFYIGSGSYYVLSGGKRRNFKNQSDLNSRYNPLTIQSLLDSTELDADGGEVFDVQEYYSGTGGGGKWITYQSGSFDASSYVIDHPSLPLQLVLSRSQKVNDRMFGCYDGKADSSSEFFDFIKFCWLYGKHGYIESSELNFSDGVNFQGSESASNVYGSLVISGGCNITLGDNATKAALTIQYVKYVDVTGITVDGNKENQTTTIDGLQFFWIETLIARAVRGDNCYRHGVYLFKVKNLSWELGGGSNNGGVDNSVVSNGIFAAPVGSGYIKGAKCHNNNPSTMQPGENDGNGIQLGLSGSDDSFWNAATDLRQLEIESPDCVGNGRRGVKVQRSDTVVFNGSCSNNNSANVLVIETAALDNVKIYGMKLGSTGDPTSNTVKLGSTAGGVVKNIHIFGNTFLGSPSAQGVDIDIDSQSVRVHDNIEEWSGGLSAQRYIARSGTLDISISTNDTVNDLSSGQLKLTIPDELSKIQSGQIETPYAKRTIGVTSSSIVIDSYDKSLSISVAPGTTLLNNITGGYEGQMITIRTLSDAGDVTVQSRVGNIYLNENTNAELTDSFDSLMLQAVDDGGLVWCEISRSNNL